MKHHKASFDLADCAHCPLNERPIVYGHGKVNEPEIAFVAEAPGETEVEQGVPLIGKSGSLLRRIITELGMDAGECYYTNICLCRPAGNKKPKSEAIQACQARLAAELAAVKPKVVVTLGSTATKALALHRLPITKSYGMYTEISVRGMNGEQVDLGIVPTFHPSFILRNGSKSKPEPYADFEDNLWHAIQIARGEAPGIEEPPYDNYRHVTTQKGYEGFLAEFAEAKWAACDLETTTTDFFTGQVLCVGFGWKRESAWVVDWALLDQNPENTQALNEILAHVPLSFQNGMFDIPFMWHNGLTNAQYYLDTMQAHYLLDERQYTHGLERLAVKYYHAPPYKSEFRESIGVRGHASSEVFSEKILEAPQEELFDYNGADVDYTFRLSQDLVKLVKEEGQLSVLKDIEMPSCRMFTEIYMNGLLIDGEYLQEMGEEWGAGLERTASKMQEIVDKAVENLDETYYKEYGDKYVEKWRKEGINTNSPDQLAHLLYDVLGLYPFGGEEWRDADRIDEEVISASIQTVEDEEALEYWKSNRTAISQSAEGMLKGISGRTTQAYALYWLKQQHEFPTILLEYRHANKRYSNYYSNFKDHMYRDNRIRPQYDTVATRTGRKSSRNPALHNLPRGDEIYNLVIPDPGWCLLHADYAQAELRMMAHYSGDEDLLYVLETSDVHTEQVKDMYGLTDEDIVAMDKTELSDKRIAAKMITFGLPYGRSAKGLAPQLGVSVGEAQEFIDVYFGRYPVLHRWIKENRRKGVEEHVALSVFGRRRRFPFIPDRYAKKEMGRQAGNFPIQSAINDLTLLAQINSIRACKEHGIPVQPGMHIHDSLNISVPVPYWLEAVRLVNRTMLDIPFETKIPFRGEVEIGSSWGNMITVVTKTSKWAELDPEDENVPEYLFRTIPEAGGEVA